MDDTTKAASGRKGKVARTLDEDGLANLGDELVAQWTAEENRMSLRALADHFNKQLLESRLDQQQADMLNGEIDNLYTLLTSDEVTSGTRIQAENRLREYGVDVESLQSDFVSRQAIHTYLTKQREAEYQEPESADIVERRLEELQRLSSRQRAVTERTISTLQESDQLDLGEFQVLVSVQVQCMDCGRQSDTTELLERGGCDCST